MIKILFLLAISLNANAQTISTGFPSMSEIKKLFNNNSSEEKIKSKKYNFINKNSDKKEAEYLLFCYTATGIEIPRYSGVGLVAWQGKFLATDVETVDGKFIRVPSSSCYIESAIKKK